MKQLSTFEQKMNDWIDDHLRRVSFVQKIFFLDHLRTMIHASLSLVEALEILEKEVGQRYFASIIGHIREDVEKGRTLSETLGGYPTIFPPMYVQMVAYGEISGRLDESLDQIVHQMKKTHELTSSIRGAMIYPSIILVAMGGIGIMMATLVLPKLINIFKEFDAELPLATRILVATVTFISNPTYFALLGFGIILGFTLFFVFLKKSPSFRHTIHATTLRLPIVGRVVKQINLARFSLTLSSLLKSTIPIVEALDITAGTCTNLLYQETLRGATKKVKTGENLSSILRSSSKLFPPMVTEMIMVGERTGQIDQLLHELSLFFGAEVDKTTKNFTTIIEPVIIIFLGVAVGGMAVAVIMPMYSLVQHF